MFGQVYHGEPVFIQDLVYTEDDKINAKSHAVKKKKKMKKNKLKEKVR